MRKMIVRSASPADRELFYSSCRPIISNYAFTGQKGENTGELRISDLLFFDIETTGLSPKESSVYLIGCMYEAEDGPVLTQLFAETPSEEATLISAFSDIVRSHPVAVHYNGSTFDIPFLRARAEKLAVDLCAFISHIDLYRELKHVKAMLGLRSMRMKAMEEYVGIRRQDIYHGGELIELYIKYVSLNKLNILRRSTTAFRALDDGVAPAGRPRPGRKITASFSDRTGLRMIGSEDCNELLRILLLHNYEDVENMLFIAPLTEIIGFVNGRFRIIDIGVSRSEKISGNIILNITLAPDATANTDIFRRLFLSSRSNGRLLKATTAGGDLVMIDCVPGSQAGAVSIRLEAAETELKLFFPNYKDYYYLKNEDYAIHKSLGQFMDKEKCVKCTAANCYTRKNAVFVPVFEKKGGALGDIIYLYRRNAPDKALFADVNDLISHPEAAVVYVMQLFGSIV